MTTMVEVKTSDLIGSALDWAVANYVTGVLLAIPCPPIDALAGYSPSTDWKHGGPLFDEYNVATTCPFGVDADDEPHWACAGGGESYGPTKLIAACRAIVAARSGGTVQIPIELV